MQNACQTKQNGDNTPETAARTAPKQPRYGCPETISETTIGKKNPGGFRGNKETSYICKS